jgi:hypothetical protein
MLCNIISTITPTCNVDAFNNLFKPSLHYLLPIKNILTFCFIFQPPWTEEGAKEAVNYIEDLGFAVRYTFKEYDRSRGIQLNRMREECAMLNPTAPIYFLIDDDFKILSEKYAEDILRSAHYLLDNERCGFVQMGGVVPWNRDKIGFAGLNQYYVLLKGLFYKNLRLINPDAKTVFEPEESLPLTGGDNERIGVAERIYHGYYPAIMGKDIDVLHVMNPENENKKIAREYVLTWRSDKMLKNGNSKLIREKYLPSYVKRVGKMQCVCDIKHYIEHNGLNFIQLRYKKYNYQNYSFDNVLHDLIARYLYWYENNPLLNA